MSDVKWIRLNVNMFEDEKIRLIEALPEADTILILWVKLLAQAGKTNASGYIYLNERIPFTDEMLATIFNRPIGTVRLALKTFQQFGMIDITDENFISIMNWEKHQNVDGLEKIRQDTKKRVQRHREKQRTLMSSNQCQYCGEPATGYDHILATARGGSDEDFNKIECCIDCNRMKNDKPLVDFLNNNRDKINDDLVANNSKLKRYVTLHPVTNRYTVTHGNAIDKEEELDKEIDKEKKKSNKPSRPKRVYDEQSVHYKLAFRLYQNILNNNPDYKQPNLQSWANDVRLMMEQDDRTEEQIVYLMDWCQNNSFWKSNILSISKLREKFDQLVIRVKEDIGKKNQSIRKDVPRAYQSLQDWADEE